MSWLSKVNLRPHGPVTRCVSLACEVRWWTMAPRHGSIGFLLLQRNFGFRCRAVACLFVARLQMFSTRQFLYSHGLLRGRILTVVRHYTMLACLVMSFVYLTVAFLSWVRSFGCEDQSGLQTHDPPERQEHSCATSSVGNVLSLRRATPRNSAGMWELSPGPIVSGFF